MTMAKRAASKTDKPIAARAPKASKPKVSPVQAAALSASPVAARFAEEAEPQSVTRDQLLQYMSVGTTATREGIRGDAQQRRSSASYWTRYMRGNPARYIQEIMPTQRASASNDFIPTLVQDAALYDMLDEMVDKDAVIGGTESTLAAQILAREQRFEVDDEDDARAVEIRDFVEKACTEMRGMFSWTAALRNILLGARRHGFSASEIIWKVDGGRFVPKTIIHRHPGQFDFDSLGNLYIYGEGSTYGQAPPNKFVVHRNVSLYGNPFGTSDIFPLRWPWYIKKTALKAWADGVETYGLPILTGTIEADSFAGTNGPSVRDQRYSELMDAFATIRGESGLVLPPGVDVKALSRGLSNSSTPHEALIDYLDRCIVRYLSGSTLTTMENAGTGSLAQSKTHGQIAAERLVSLCRALAETVQCYIVEPLVRLNFGDDAPMPRFVIDVDDEEDVEQGLKIFEAAQKLGVETSRRQFREWFGVDAPEDDEDTINSPPPAAPQPANGDPQETRDEMIRRLFKFSAAPKKPAPKKKPAPSPAVAKFDDRGREFELTFVDILASIARALKDANQAAIIDAIRQGLDRIRDNYGSDAIMTVGAAQVARMTAPLLDSDLAEAFAAIRIQAALATMRIASRAVPGIGVGLSLDEIAPGYRAGIEWMLARDIMTKTDVEDMVRAVSLISDGLNAAAAERSIREHVFALAHARTEELTAQMTRLITGAVERGDTVGTFLRAMDDVIERGELPAMTDAYLEMVFRTETANIYQRQRLASMNDPQLVDHIWGVELFAIDDDRSRPTHAATDGVFLKKGSAAYNAWLPGPPYSYNCRCTSAPVMVGEVEEETPGALEIVQAIERFGCGHDHDDFHDNDDTTTAHGSGLIQSLRRALRL